MEKRIIPKFETETDEANWWFDNGDELGKDFEQAFAEGSLRRRTNQVREQHPRSSRTELPQTT